MGNDTCQNHENMLEKSEFRWVFGLAFSILSGAAMLMYGHSASVDQLRAVDEKVEYRDKNAERRAQRLEKQMEALNAKLDKIDGFLRGGTAGTRYR